MPAANSADQPQDDLVPAQEKLEWVTPKISQMMGSGDTLQKFAFDTYETRENNYGS